MSLQQVSIFGVYILNQDFITEKFCINKDKPELACKGQCHMKNMMAEQEEKKETQQFEEILVAMFFQECVQEMPFLSKSSSFSLDKGKLLSDSYESKMFQPPRV